MRLAAFETSTEWCSVALWIDGEICGVEERAANRHGELVLPMLERLAASAGSDAHTPAEVGRCWAEVVVVVGVAAGTADESDLLSRNLVIVL